MAGVQDLYQESILDHYRNPRNFHELERSNRHAIGSNPLCGDTFSIYLQINNGMVHDIGFTGSGCAISIASASMMTECLKGKTEEEAKKICAGFILSMTGQSNSPQTDMPGSLTAFMSVREYPVRVKCATLAWHTLGAALESQQETVSTDGEF